MSATKKRKSLLAALAEEAGEEVKVPPKRPKKAPKKTKKPATTETKKTKTATIKQCVKYVEKLEAECEKWDAHPTEKEWRELGRMLPVKGSIAKKMARGTFLGLLQNSMTPELQLAVACEIFERGFFQLDPRQVGDFMKEQDLTDPIIATALKAVLKKYAKRRRD